MKLKIRTKVTLGILFLFLEFLVIGVLTIYFLSTINNSAELMIKNNHQSVQYAENMLQVMEDIHASSTSLCLNKTHRPDKAILAYSFKKFEEHLAQEEANITEYGEKDLVQYIRQKYTKYKTMVFEENTDSIKNKADFYFVNIAPLYNDLKSNVFAISKLNMQAIIQKNASMNEMISSIYKKLTGALTLCFLITFSFMINFPRYIANPIKEITENIKEIANRNFKSRIKFTSGDEFDQLAEAFNYMAEKLEENQSNVAPLPLVANETIGMDEGLIRDNIRKLLDSVSRLMDSLPDSPANELLQQQTIELRKVEQGLGKIAES